MSTEITRFEEEILICLCYTDELCEVEILTKLNCDRPKGWTKITQPRLNKTLKKMLGSELVEIARVDVPNYNKKYYKIADEGYSSLSQGRINRRRLGDPSVIPLPDQA